MTSALARRVAASIGLPSALLLLTPHVPLPGLPQSLATHVAAPSASLTAFALGLTPLLVAYGCVEASAFLVPRWGHLRHENPAGRAQLERAAGWLGLALATAQAVWMAQSIPTLAQTAAPESGPTGATFAPTAVTLVGGFCLQWLAARWITNQRLVNGVVALLASRALYELVFSIGRQFDLAVFGRDEGALAFPVTLGEPRDLILMATGLAVAALTSVVVSRDLPRSSPRPSSDATTGPGSARRLATHPALPLPLGSGFVHPVTISVLALLASPSDTRLLPPGVGSRLAALDGIEYRLVLFVCTLVVMLASGALANRSKETEEFVLRVCGSRDAARAGTRHSFRRAILPSALFFATLILAGMISRCSVVAVPLIVAATVDLYTAVRRGLRHGDLVPIWEERRPVAVPVVQALLAEHGLMSEVHGRAFGQLFQLFAPYAPIEVLVARRDEAAAKALLQDVCSDGERARVPTDEVPLQQVELPDGRRHLSLLLAAWTTVAAGAVFAAHASLPWASHPEAPHVPFQVVAVDDSFDAFDHIRPEDIPPGEGVSLWAEKVPQRGRERAQRTYARLDFRQDETPAEAKARFRRWLGTVPLPAGARFGVEDVTKVVGWGDRQTNVGLRSVTLAGSAAVTEHDVVEATVGYEAAGDSEGRRAVVLLRLSDAGSRGLEEITTAQLQLRIAVLVGDQVAMTPVVRSPITGGYLTIPMARGDFRSGVGDAKRLAHGVLQRL